MKSRIAREAHSTTPAIMDNRDAAHFVDMNQRSIGPAESSKGSYASEEQEEKMDLLWTVAIILVILWVLGLVTSYTLGGFVHILLVLAIIVVLIRVIQGRRPV
jgi:Family of unknown function (DUF5670)